jgi:hypothetical protein
VICFIFFILFVLNVLGGALLALYLLSAVFHGDKDHWAIAVLLVVSGVDAAVLLWLDWPSLISAYNQHQLFGGI